MIYIYILIFIIIILSIIKIKTETKESYCNSISFNNYANDIYSIRPPYKMSYKYRPEKLGPFRILKSNFLNFPIEGYENMESGIDKMKNK